MMQSYVKTNLFTNDELQLDKASYSNTDSSEYLDFTVYYWISYRTNSGLGELSIG